MLNIWNTQREVFIWTNAFKGLVWKRLLNMRCLWSYVFFWIFFCCLYLSYLMSVLVIWW